jgi:zinc transport system substrate-binding protein
MKNRNRFLILFLILFLFGCNNQKDINKKEKIFVYTSFYLPYDFANKIGGDKIYLKNITNNDPHDWEPSIRDIASLQRADVFIYNGIIETWIDKLKNSLDKNKNIYFINLTQDIKITNQDPHIWLDPKLAEQELYKIAQTFSQIDPKNKDYYFNNYYKNKLKLEDLDMRMRKDREKFNYNNIIVAHNAYKYFCDAYDLNQIVLEDSQENSEITPERIKNAINFINKNKIKYVFYEDAPSKILKTIAQETGATMLELNPCEHLTQEQIKNNEEYFSIMNKNIDNLIKALK